MRSAQDLVASQPVMTRDVASAALNTASKQEEFARHSMLRSVEDEPRTVIDWQLWWLLQVTVDTLDCGVMMVELVQLPSPSHERSKCPVDADALIMAPTHDLPSVHSMSHSEDEGQFIME